MSFIHSIACVSPETRITQPNAAEHIAARIEAASGLIDRLYRYSGVVERQTVLPSLEKLYGSESPTTAQRMLAYECSAAGLAIASAHKALELAALSPKEITHLITVSCTGFYAPGIDHAIIAELGLEPTVVRTHIGFMGCHAALNALYVADSFARSCGATVLVVCVELCSLHLQYSNVPDLLVANSLFSDGAAAFVCSCHEQSDSQFEVLSMYSQILHGTTDLMSWRIKDHGFEMSLSPRLPKIISTTLPAILESWACKHGWKLDNLLGWAVHPGGPRILNECESLLGDLAISRQVLRQNGNMSSPTVLFILDRLAKVRGNYGVIAFGPGITFEGAMLRRL